MKANQMFVNKWIETIWCICTVEYYTAIKSKVLPFVEMWMDLQTIMLNEDRQKHFLWYYLYVESKITNVYVKQKQTHRYINKLVVTSEDR